SRALGGPFGATVWAQGAQRPSPPTLSLWERALQTASCHAQRGSLEHVLERCLAGVLPEHDPAAVAGGGERRERGLGSYLDLPRASGTPELFDAIGVHGGTGSPLPPTSPPPPSTTSDP